MLFQFSSFQSSSVHSFPSFHLFARLTSSTPFHFIHVRPKTTTMPKILQNSSMENDVIFCRSSPPLFSMPACNLRCDRALPRNRTTSRCPFLAAITRGVAAYAVPWSLLAPDFTQKSDNFKVPLMSSNPKRRCSIVFHALVFVGTRLHQKSDNFKVPSMSSNPKRRCSIVCHASVFVGTRLHQKSDNFKLPLTRSNGKRR